MPDETSGNDHRGTLAWLDAGLVYALARHRERLVSLLGLVRTEVLFEIEPARGNVSRDSLSRDRPASRG